LEKGRSILKWVYFLMILAGVAIPSDGAHGILSVKSIFFIAATLCTAVYAFCQQKLNLYQFKLLIFFLTSLSLLFGWLLISLYYRETTPIAQSDQFKLFIITLVFPLITFYLVNEKVLAPSQIYKAAIYGCFGYAFIKILLVTLHLLNVIDLWTFMKNVGIRYMRMDIYQGLERVQTSVDIAAPFIVFFVLQSDRLGLGLSRLFKYSFILFTLFSTFLSFSRYLLFVYFISCFFYWTTLRSKKLLATLLSVTAVLLMAYFMIGSDKVNKVIERRIFSFDNYQSDLTRTQQVDAMVEQIESYLYLGKGIGGYAPQSIREPTVLHLYEVQWVAFLMQFGLLGLLCLLFPLAYISLRLAAPPFSRVRWSFLGVFFLWLFSGFTNPFLISLTSGIMYALFYLSSDILKPKFLPAAAHNARI
jgi:hypothetical protein